VRRISPRRDAVHRWTSMFLMQLCG
jgi:hypothetical protein